MLKAFKYRLYPDEQQSVLINKHIGSCRFLYNLALETKQTAYAGTKTSLTAFDLINQIPDLKKELIWLKEINSQSLQQAIVNMESAFMRFFKGQGNFPNFKKKNDKQSFSVPQNVEVDFEKKKIYLPKFRKGITIVLHREFKGNIKQATINKTPTGKYFVSILVDTAIEKIKPSPVNVNTTIGIDLGVKTFLVTSDGREYDNPKYLKQQLLRLQFTQRKYSKHKGKRTKYRLAIIYERVANQRKDFLNKVSTELIKNHDSFAIENLNIQGMSATCKPKQDESGKYLPNGQSAKSGLNRSITDAGWGMFVGMLEYKAEWYGKNILQIGRFEPSSKTCSCCGSINKDLTLSDREWTCPVCGAVLNRDVNASINIKNFALKKYLSAEHRLENRSELPTLVGVLTCEAPTL